MGRPAPPVICVLVVSGQGYLEPIIEQYLRLIFRFVRDKPPRWLTSRYASASGITGAICSVSSRALRELSAWDLPRPESGASANAAIFQASPFAWSCDLLHHRARYDAGPRDA